MHIPIVWLTYKCFLWWFFKSTLFSKFIDLGLDLYTVSSIIDFVFPVNPPTGRMRGVEKSFVGWTFDNGADSRTAIYYSPFFDVFPCCLCVISDSYFSVSRKITWDSEALRCPAAKNFRGKQSRRHVGMTLVTVNSGVTKQLRDFSSILSLLTCFSCLRGRRVSLRVREIFRGQKIHW